MNIYYLCIIYMLYNVNININININIGVNIFFLFFGVNVYNVCIFIRDIFINFAL
jgi:hypothetical protein